MGCLSCRGPCRGTRMSVTRLQRKRLRHRGGGVHRLLAEPGWRAGLLSPCTHGPRGGLSGLPEEERLKKGS